ncbi:MAG: hypothetical protein V1674_01425 [Candidatus Omnitrophota bacterium]
MKKINNRGFSIILSIFIILTFSALGLMFLNLLATQTDTYLKEISSTQAFYLAEAARNYALEYYINWGRDFTKETDDQFPNLTMANGKAKQFGNGRFEITYPNRLERSATARFIGIANPNTETQISRTIEKTFSDAAAVVQDMKNFAVYVGLPNNPFNLGRPCGCGISCATDMNYFAVDVSNVYINGAVNFGCTVINNGGDLYVNSLAQLRGYYWGGCVVLYHFLYTPGYPFGCNYPCPLEPGGPSSCNCNNVGQCNNNCGHGSGSSNIFFGTDVGAFLFSDPSAKPTPTKPTIINNYFAKELTIAAQKTSGDLTIDASSPNYSGGLKGRTIYVNGRVTINSSDNSPLRGPGSIVATGGSATNDGIRILNTGRIRDRINFIVSRGITIEDNSWLGGTYNASLPNQMTGAGVVLYSNFNTTPTMFIGNNTKVKARLLQTAGVTEIRDQFWGLVYTQTIRSFPTINCPNLRVYGNLFIDQIFPTDQYLCGWFFGGPFFDPVHPERRVVWELPLKARGLYNISESPAGYYEP